jgi:pyrimidine operon attenuation protein/uracil phosphoribosyltransferase
MDALNDFGRPAAVRLAVLVDRGHRELPIRPDFVGVTLNTQPHQRVRVLLDEFHDVDAVVIENTQPQCLTEADNSPSAA